MLNRRTTSNVNVMKKTDRIKSLQDERENIQKNEFTTWINTILQEEGMKVEDLFLDLSDGRKLTRLLELVFAEKFTRLPKGNFRMHRIENVNKCLAFLRTKVSLPCIGAEDIVDGNRRLILGLIWTIMKGSPTKIEDHQEILLTPLPQVEHTTRLHELIEPVNQESLKVQQNTSSVTVEREAVNELEDDEVLQHTTCVLQAKRDTDIGKEDIELSQNAVPVKCVKESDDLSKEQLLQQKQQEADEEIKAIHQDDLKKKQREVKEDEKPDIYQLQLLKQNEIQHETIENCENCPKQQQTEEINEAGMFKGEQLIEQENVDVVKATESQYKPEKADEINVVQQEQQETEPVEDYKIEELEQERCRSENLHELHLSEKEKHVQSEKPELEELRMEGAGDSHKPQSSNYDKEQDDEHNREMDLLQKKNEEDADGFKEMHLTEQKQELDHQSIIEVNKEDKKEEVELKKLLPSEPKQQQDHEDEESEVKQKDIEVDDESLRIQKQEYVEQPQQDNSIALTTPGEVELNKLLPSELKQQQDNEDEESEIKQKNIENDGESLRIQKQVSVEQPRQDNSIDKTIPGNSQVDYNEDEADFNEEYDSDCDIQSRTSSTFFLQELRQECNRRGLIERQREAKEKEEREKRESEFYKLLEQMSKNCAPMESENEETRKNFNEEKHKKEKLWKQREVERLQEEADRHREETERQEQLKYEQEEEDRQKQLLIDNGELLLPYLR